MSQPKIGIVSGIGPLAGSDVFAKLLKYAATEYSAVEDSEYPDILLLNNGIEGVGNTGTLNTKFEAGVVSMVKRLEQNQASVIGIACNTAHIYLDKIKTKPATKLVNLIDEVATVAAKDEAQYLLLTSSTSKKEKLYQSYLEKHNVMFRTTSSEQQKLLDEAIGLIMAYELDKAGELLDKVLESAKQAGFAAAIAGCTELPIAIDHCRQAYSLKVLDSNQILAQALADVYYFEKGANHD